MIGFARMADDALEDGPHLGAGRRLAGAQDGEARVGTQSPIGDVISVATFTKPRSTGKTFRVVDGQLKKDPPGNLIRATVNSYECANADSFANLLRNEAKNTNTILYACTWRGDEDGSEFEYTTLGAMERLTGFSRHDERVGGIHERPGRNGRPLRRIAARSKFGMARSAWLLLDLDKPPGWPWGNLTIEDALAKWEPFLPGITRCTRIICRSSSARVHKQGEDPKPRTHCWVKVTHPERIGMLRAYLKFATVNAHCAFRYIFADGRLGEWRSVFDWAPFTLSQPTFIASPVLDQSAIDHGYVIADAGVEIVNPDGGLLSLAHVTMPSEPVREEYQRRTGHDVAVNRDGSLIVRNLLRLTTPIETKHGPNGHTVMTVGELHEWALTLPVTDSRRFHLRCETPFRKSDSENGFLVLTGGTIRAHDNGEATTYTLVPEDASALNHAVTERLAVALRPHIPETSAIFGPTPANIIPAGEGASMLARLAQEIRPTNLRPELLPDPDLTQGSKVAIKQAVSPVRVEYVMNAIGVQAAINVYGGVPRLRVASAADWYDPASDRSEAAFGTIHHACVRCGMTAASSIRSAIMQVAEANPFNPVLDWIASKPWDGMSRFDELVASLTLRDPAQEPWKRVALRRWLIQAVVAWRNYDKGDAATVVGSALVLQGPKGRGKTSWVKSLLPAGEVAEGVELHLDWNPVDAVMAATIKPLAELGELDRTLGRSAVSALKNFLSKAVDIYRPPYGIAPRAHPRCTVFIATINMQDFLTDEALARRLWPFEVAGCDAGHGIDLQQLWAEVATWADAGEQHWLTDAEKVMHATAVSAHELGGQVADLVNELVEQRERAAGRPETDWQLESPSILLARHKITANTTNYQTLRDAMDRASFTYNTNRKAWRVPPKLTLLLPTHGVSTVS